MCKSSTTRFLRIDLHLEACHHNKGTSNLAVTSGSGNCIPFSLQATGQLVALVQPIAHKRLDHRQLKEIVRAEIANKPLCEDAENPRLLEMLLHGKLKNMR